MNIAVDISQIAFEGTGVARYTEGLIKALLTIPEHSYIFFFSSLRKKLRPDLKSLILKNHHLKEYQFPPTALHFLWNELHRLSVEKLVGNIDLFIASDWTQPPTKKAKKLSFIHDLIVYTHPQTTTTNTEFTIQNLTISPNIEHTQKVRLQWIKKESDLVVSLSHATTEDIHTILGIPRKRITTLYPFIRKQSITASHVSGVMKKYKLTRPFLLSVGKIEPRKNIGSLIAAYTAIKNPAYDLVIVGARGWDNISGQKPSDSIHMLGYVPEHDLQSLYSAAFLFVFPSLYEGFGYPLVEAMSAGCPVLTSNISSMKEIADGYGMLCDPKNVDDIRKRIEKIMNDKHLQKDLKEKGLRRAKDFSFEKYVGNLRKILSQMDN